MPPTCSTGAAVRPRTRRGFVASGSAGSTSGLRRVRTPARVTGLPLRLGPRGGHRLPDQGHLPALGGQHSPVLHRQSPGPLVKAVGAPHMTVSRQRHHEAEHDTPRAGFGRGGVRSTSRRVRDAPRPRQKQPPGCSRIMSSGYGARTLDHRRRSRGHTSRAVRRSASPWHRKHPPG